MVALKPLTCNKIVAAIISSVSPSPFLTNVSLVAPILLDDVVDKASAVLAHKLATVVSTISHTLGLFGELGSEASTVLIWRTKMKRRRMGTSLLEIDGEKDRRGKKEDRTDEARDTQDRKALDRRDMVESFSLTCIVGVGVEGMEVVDRRNIVESFSWTSIAEVGVEGVEAVDRRDMVESFSWTWVEVVDACADGAHVRVLSWLEVFELWLLLLISRRVLQRSQIIIILLRRCIIIILLRRCISYENSRFFLL